jgi:hypothetical protein
MTQATRRKTGGFFHGISLFAVPCRAMPCRAVLRPNAWGMLTLFVHPKICSSPLLVYVLAAYSEHASPMNF